MGERGNEFEFLSEDGTVIRGWSNGGEGIPVLLVPGNATVPEGFPSLMDADSGLGVASFYMRGTFGSQRPADPSRIRVEHHVEDALALLDHLQVDRAVVVGWSLGVNVAFEFARRHPERTIGVLAVGGVPGGTHATLWHPLPLPGPVRSALSYAVVMAGQAIGPLVNRVTRAVPIRAETARVLSASRLVGTGADPVHIADFFVRVARQDLRWVATLARAGFEHAPMHDLHALEMPVTFLAGSRDWLTSPVAIRRAAHRIPHASVHIVPATHTIGMEHPELIVELIRDIAAEGGSEHAGTPAPSGTTRMSVGDVRGA